jgi:hypothetical protein
MLRALSLLTFVQSGVWNTTEAIPLLIKSAQVLGALPELDDVGVLSVVLYDNGPQTSDTT